LTDEGCDSNPDEGKPEACLIRGIISNNSCEQAKPEQPGAQTH
jgi:hypothetical protein